MLNIIQQSSVSLKVIGMMYVTLGCINNYNANSQVSALSHLISHLSRHNRHGIPLNGY